MKEKKGTTKPSYLSLVGDDPFRLLFPVGWLAAIAGVAVWPLYFYQLGVEVYPLVSHTRIMTHGFVGSFLIGFLATAGPRMLSAKRIGLRWVLGLALLQLFGIAAQFANKPSWGDASFVLALLALSALLWVRAGKRGDVPPPGFLLVLLGAGCGVLGTFMLATESGREVDFFGYTLARLLLYQGFPLLPIMGVGPFFLPRLFRLPNRHSFDESRLPPRGWWPRVMLSLLCGLGVIFSFLLEAYGWLLAGYLLRTMAAGVMLVGEVPFFRKRGKIGSIGACAASGLFLLLAGLAATGFFPFQRIAVEHTTLIGGFGLVIFAVASRVILGHTGHSTLLKVRQVPLLLFLFLIAVAVVSRVSGDFLPSIRISHYIYAAQLWIGGVLIWGLHTLTRVTTPDEE